ncbi:30S ribosomal protein S20 [Patescibacteria group bacterium]
MPVSVTAKRALRSSKAKRLVNKKILTQVDVAVRKAKKAPTEKNKKEAISLVDKAAKKNIFHKNKAARLKSQISKYKKTNSPKKPTKSKKTSKK